MAEHTNDGRSSRGRSQRDRAAAILEQALARPAADRIAYLDEACGADVELRAELDSLLRANDDAGSFMQGAGAPFNHEHATESTDRSRKPRTVDIDTDAGRYRVLKKIGEGGFAQVFLAEQLDPIRRQVALKILKLGMDSKAVLARFAAERQTLARMDNSGIATIFDAGMTKRGRAFIAMEYIPGAPITDFARGEHMALEDRLQLMLAVCRAVQHAHARGVIHRDLKPSNILVRYEDTDPMPKIIDFGVAKLINQDLTAATIVTHPGQLVGTLEYMSPEQLRAASQLDARSDVYSLGVVLYELITGERPFSAAVLRESGLEVYKRLVESEHPPSPSTRLRKLSPEEASDAQAITEHFRIDSRALARRVAGDLDRIVLKCLEKERDRRYQSAAELADDLRRFLSGEPVAAGATTIARMPRLLRKAWIPVAAVAVIAGAFFAGRIWNGDASNVDKPAEPTFVQDEASSTPSQSTPTDSMVAANADASSATLGEPAKSDANTPQVASAAAEHAEQEGRELPPGATADDAQTQLTRVVARPDEHEPAEPIETEHDAAQRNPALAEIDVVRLGPMPPAPEIAPLPQVAGPPDVPATEMTIPIMAQELRSMTGLPAAVEDPLRALAARVKDSGPDAAATLDTATGLMWRLREAGQHERAIEAGKAALAGWLNRGGARLDKPWEDAEGISASYASLGNHDEAVAWARRAFDGRRFALGDRHPKTWFMGQIVAERLRGANQMDDCADMWAHVFRGSAAIEPGERSTWQRAMWWGSALHDANRPREAEYAFRTAMDGFLRMRGSDDPEYWHAAEGLGHALEKAGDTNGARWALRVAYQEMRRHAGENDLVTWHLAEMAGHAEEDARDWTTAAALLTQSLIGRYKMLGTDGELTRHTARMLIRALDNTGDAERAKDMREFGRKGGDPPAWLIAMAAQPVAAIPYEIELGDGVEVADEPNAPADGAPLANSVRGADRARDDAPGRGGDGAAGAEGDAAAAQAGAKPARDERAQRRLQKLREQEATIAAQLDAQWRLIDSLDPNRKRWPSDGAGNLTANARGVWRENCAQALAELKSMQTTLKRLERIERDLKKLTVRPRHGIDIVQMSAQCKAQTALFQMWRDNPTPAGID